METVEVTDMYEASYLLLSKCTFKGVECVTLAGTLGCRFSFVATRELSYYQELFRSREATVELWKFRQAYNTINGYMHQAKKSFDLARRVERREAREGREVTELDGYVNRPGNDDPEGSAA